MKKRKVEKEKSKGKKAMDKAVASFMKYQSEMEEPSCPFWYRVEFPKTLVYATRPSNVHISELTQVGD